MPAFDAQRFPRLAYELLVLAALADGRKHGYQIALDCEQRSGGMFVLQHGTLYPILHRLEGEGLVRGVWSGRAGERQKKVYALRPKGRERLEEDSAYIGEVLNRLNGILREAKRVAATGS